MLEGARYVGVSVFVVAVSEGVCVDVFSVSHIIDPKNINHNIRIE